MANTLKRDMNQYLKETENPVTAQLGGIFKTNSENDNHALRFWDIKDLLEISKYSGAKTELLELQKAMRDSKRKVERQLVERPC